MATTKQDMQNADDEYNAAFNEDNQPSAEPTDDQVFGTSDAPHGEQPAGGAPVETPNGQGEPAGEAATDPAEASEPTEVGEVGSPGAPAGESEPSSDAMAQGDLEKERQRLRSWEGRLKAAEAALKAKTPSNPDQGVADGIEQVAEQAEQSGNTELADEAENLSEKVEQGQMSADDAIKTLSEDFGPEFVQMIMAIAHSAAQQAGKTAAHEATAEMGRTIDEIIGDITNSKARAHFAQIKAKHPDFAEVGQSQGFADWVNSLQGEDQAKARQVIESGTADEINMLLDTYKAAGKSDTPQAEAPAADPVVDNEQMSAAEGVRSRGMALPEQPAAAADDYAGAWEQA